MIYLCHKCCGHLDDNANGVSAYGCGCISGYIRDWQEPTDPADVRGMQRQHMQALLDMYLSQKRPETSQHVQGARSMLAKLA